MVQSFDISGLLDSSHAALPPRAPAKILVASNVTEYGDLWPRSDKDNDAHCFGFQLAPIIELECEIIPSDNVEPLLVAVVDADTKPLMLLPLAIEARGDFAGPIKRLRVLKFFEGPLLDYNSPILYPPVANWSEDLSRSVWKALCKRLPPFDIVDFRNMPHSIGDLPNPLRFFNQMQSSISGHAVRFKGEWEDFAAKLPRRNTWKTKKFRDLGTLSLEVAQTPTEYDVFIEALIRQKRRRYLETQGKDGLERPGYIECLTAARRIIYPSGPVCLFALKANDVIIATNLGIITGRRFSGQFTTFEAGPWGTYSPGQLLMNRVIEWCFRHGVEVFDFGMGDQKYKETLCDITLELSNAEFATSLKGAIALNWRRTSGKISTRRARSQAEMAGAKTLAANGPGAIRAVGKAGKSLARWPSPALARDFICVLKTIGSRRQTGSVGTSES